jgi:hypothetical protein
MPSGEAGCPRRDCLGRKAEDLISIREAFANGVNISLYVNQRQSAFLCTAYILLASQYYVKTVRLASKCGHYAYDRRCRNLEAVLFRIEATEMLVYPS